MERLGHANTAISEAFLNLERQAVARAINYMPNARERNTFVRYIKIKDKKINIGWPAYFHLYMIPQLNFFNIFSKIYWGYEHAFSSL